MVDTPEPGATPAPVRIAADVWQVFSPIPEGTIDNTLTYVLVDSGGRIHLVDPGWGSDHNLAQLERSLAAIGFGLADVASVIATHHHPDHLGIAGRLREISGARVIMSTIEFAVLERQLAPETRDRAAYEAMLDSWAVPAERRPELRAQFDRPAWLEPVVPDLGVAEADVLALDGHDLLVVATPGHTGGHICLVDDRRGLIYTGDHVLPQIYAGVGIGSLAGAHPLADYVDSLARLAPWDELTVLPGHEHTFTGLRQRRQDIARHHLRRTEEVLALTHRLGDAPVWEYARQMTWTSGWDGLINFWLHSALTQTSMHLDVVRSGRIDDLLGREWR